MVKSHILHEVTLLTQNNMDLDQKIEETVKSSLQREPPLHVKLETLGIDRKVKSA